MSDANDEIQSEFRKRFRKQEPLPKPLDAGDPPMGEVIPYEDINIYGSGIFEEGQYSPKFGFAPVPDKYFTSMAADLESDDGPFAALMRTDIIEGFERVVVKPEVASE